MKVLVIGGAGYIGSHVVKLLGERGWDVITVDNLSNGYRDFVLYGDFIQADMRDESLMEKILKGISPEAVMHFAGFIIAPESFQKPIDYYKNNISGTLSLLSAMIKANVKYIIFSSSAAVYGNPHKIPIKEDAPLNPISPYGRTKLMIEKILSDCDEAYGIKYISLRYFNAAGADESGKIGERHNPETHIIPLILEVVMNKRKEFIIFGDDYPTPDGTCIRDYIHVNDLAEAHILALEYLLDTKKSDVFNLGNQRGYSVKEIIKVVEEVTKKKVNYKVDKRRCGDPAVLVASCEKIKKELSWRPKREDLEYIITTAWNYALNAQTPKRAHNVSKYPSTQQSFL